LSHQRGIDDRTVETRASLYGAVSKAMGSMGLAAGIKGGMSLTTPRSSGFGESKHLTTSTSRLIRPGLYRGRTRGRKMQQAKWIDTPESSNITRFGYENANRVLLVEFHDGAVYEYFDVPETVFEQMRSASSKGQFLALNVKGTYRYARA
jgi:hypothetical protein